MSAGAKVGVLFVCYANICRSPLAEGIFRHMAGKRGLLGGLEIDSAGTHAMSGAPPHRLSREIAATHGFELAGSSRQLYRDDLSSFDHIVVMDRHNYATIEGLAAPSAFGSLAGYRAQIRLLRAIAPKRGRGRKRARGHKLDVPDPIAAGADAYVEVYELLERGCKALLDELA